MVYAVRKEFRRPVFSLTLASALALPSLVFAQAQTSAPSTPPPTEADAPSTLALSLADAERAATSEQPQVIAARALTAAADARAREARSPLLPQLIGTAEYLRETGNFAPRP